DVPPFLVSCYGPLRPLHSFPTRRSSDLVFRQAAQGLARVQGKSRSGDLGAGNQTARYARTTDRIRYGDSRGATRGGIARHQSALDRKSTRLNSSHVKISYAVFCLKKKKK